MAALDKAALAQMVAVSPLQASLRYSGGSRKRARDDHRADHGGADGRRAGCGAATAADERGAQPPSTPAESEAAYRQYRAEREMQAQQARTSREAATLMEAIERYSGIFQGNEIRMTRRFADFPAGDAIPPNDVLLYSDAQYQRQQVRTPASDDRTPVPTPFDLSAKIEWSPVWSLRDERFKYLPSSLVYFFYRGPGEYRIHADSNGCAAGNTLEEAVVQGFLELVERDAYAIWWYNRLQRPEVDLGPFDDTYIRELKIQLAETGRRVWVLDVTSDLGIPSFVTIAHWIENGEEFIDFGSGAHFDARIAVLRG